MSNSNYDNAPGKEIYRSHSNNDRSNFRDRSGGRRDGGGFRIRLSDNEMKAVKSIQETFLTTNQVIDATSAATSAWGLFIGIFGLAVLRSTKSNLIPSYGIYAGYGGATLIMVSTLGWAYGLLPQIAGLITLILGGLILYPLFIFALGKAMENAGAN